MKFFILTLILAFNSGIVLSQKNIYHTFPDSNAVWGLSSVCTDPGCGDLAYIKDFYTGDTLIDGLKYWKVEEYSHVMTNNSCCYPPGNSGKGYLREDSVARKVFWRTEGMDSDSLLYDFNLNIGDTIRGFLTLSSCCTLTVQSIDSILVGTTYRKRYNIDTTGIYSSDTLSIIEGIGSTRGLTNLFWGYFQIGTNLECFSVDGHIVYFSSNNSDSIPCGTISTISDFFSENNFLELEVFPNPIQDNLILKTQQVNPSYNLTLFTTQGVVVMNVNVYSNIFTINMSELANGIYILEAKTTTCSPSLIKVIKQ